MHETWEKQFGSWKSRISIQQNLPGIEQLHSAALSSNPFLSPEGPVLLVCDENTEIYARHIASGYSEAHFVCLQAGEAHKNMAGITRIFEEALASGLSRDSLFIGVGGGVICDMTACAASLWMRGAPLALVPTTLLAMVDAAIGGKTGFDFGGLKNIIGTFRPADVVCMPIATLESLPEHEWRSGRAEVLKTAFIGEAVLLEILEEKGPDWDQANCLDIITRCARLKSRVVEADPLETGTERAALNLGHSFGHALEAVCELGGISHGEGVAWGMARASALALIKGIQTQEGDHRLRALLTAFGYETGPVHPAGLRATNGDEALLRQRLISAMQGDKKKKGGTLRFVLPDGAGVQLHRLETLDELERVLGRNA